MIIYKAINKINGKSYIGKTIISLIERQNEHFSNAFYNNSQLYFYRSLRLYGWHSFKWEILQTCDNENILNDLEIFFIAYYNTFLGDGYNMTSGGDGFNWNGRKHSKKSRLKMSKTRKSKIKNGEIKIFKPTYERKCEIMKLAAKNRKHKQKEINKKISNLRMNFSKEKLNKIIKESNKTRKESYRDGKYRFKYYYLINYNGIKYSIAGSLRNICDKLNISFNRICRFIDNGKIPKSNRVNNIQSQNCTGITINKQYAVNFFDLTKIYNKFNNIKIRNIIKNEDYIEFIKLV